MDYNKLILVQQLRSDGHNFNRDAKFSILERMKKPLKNPLDNITAEIEIHEDKLSVFEH